MRVERELVELEGADGRRMTGILWLPPPDVPRRKILIVMGHGGLSHKVGANRVQYHLGQFFASRGCPVFRFDPEGLGDSDGDVKAQPRQDLFGSIESGLFKDSYRRVFEFLRPRFSDHRWVVSGVCGGAISSLLGGVESPHPIAGYALISCPVILDGVRFDYSKREPTQLAIKYLRLFLPKLFSPKAFWRFITFQSNYKLLWKNIQSLVLRSKDKVVAKLIGTKKPADPAAAAAAPAASTAPAPSTKPPVGLSQHFVKAAREAMRKAPVLFIYGNNDGFLWEFTDLYAAAHLSEAERDKVLRVVTHANHMFVWPEWQAQAFEMIDGWLTKEVATP
jgi:uncharacterized protein